MHTAALVARSSTPQGREYCSELRRYTGTRPSLCRTRWSRRSVRCGRPRSINTTCARRCAPHARPHTRCAHARRHAHASQPADAGAERSHRPPPCARGGVGWQRAGRRVCLPGCGTLRCYARWRPQALVVLSRGDDDVVSPPPLFQARRCGSCRVSTLLAVCGGVAVASRLRNCGCAVAFHARRTQNTARRMPSLRCSVSNTTKRIGYSECE